MPVANEGFGCEKNTKNVIILVVTGILGGGTTHDLPNQIQGPPMTPILLTSSPKSSAGIPARGDFSDKGVA